MVVIKALGAFFMLQVSVECFQPMVGSNFAAEQLTAMLCSRARCGVAAPRKVASPEMIFGLFEDEETKAKKAAWEERKKQAQKEFKDEQYAVQMKIIARRNDPEAMKKYYDDLAKSRREALESVSNPALEAVQKMEGTKEEKLAAFEKLKEEGKVKTVDGAERFNSDQSLGGVGIVAERMDDQNPFFLEGWVDDGTERPMKQGDGEVNFDPIGDGIERFKALFKGDVGGAMK
jgi:hypothetical protein